MSRRVDVYEVSHNVRTTELDFVEFQQMRFSPARANGFVEVPPPDAPAFREELPVYVRHSEPVQRIATPGGLDQYVAIGPRLFELLSFATKSRLSDELNELRECLDRAEARCGRLSDALADERKQLKCVEIDAAMAKLDLRAAEERQRNFLEANVITRVWRAIRGRL